MNHDSVVALRRQSASCAASDFFDVGFVERVELVFSRFVHPEKIEQSADAVKRALKLSETALYGEDSERSEQPGSMPSGEQQSRA